MTPSKQTKGYLLVASSKEIYYDWACNLLDGIKDFYPEANICLVTEERFLDSRADAADKIIFCGNHYRAKLWGMANSPWDITFYLDVDMEVLHKDIGIVFDELGESDMKFCYLQDDHSHIFMEDEFPGGKFDLCGAVCLYRKSPLVDQFMQDWYDYYVMQYAGTWWPLDAQGRFDFELYPQRLKIWDQFTLWWLTQKETKYDSLKIERFADNMKWNRWAMLNYSDFPIAEDTVLKHMSAVVKKNIEDIEL